MLIEEKKKNYKDFIQSDKFTLSSYSSLSLFQMNIRAMKRLIENEANLALKLIDSKETKGSDVSYIQLDILCKIMMMIEGNVLFFWHWILEETELQEEWHILVLL